MRLLPGGSFVHPQHFPVAVYGDECSDGGLNVRGNDVKANVVTSNLQQNSATNFQFYLSLSLSFGFKNQACRPHTKEATKESGTSSRARTDAHADDGNAPCRFVVTQLLPPTQSPIRGFKVCLAADIKLHHQRRTAWKQTSSEVSSGQALAFLLTRNAGITIAPTAFM